MPAVTKKSVFAGRRQRSSLSHQQGAILIGILLLLGIGALYLFLKQLDSSYFRLAGEQSTANSLAKAKEALVGYAVARDLTTTAASLANAQRPGDLPCPDTDDDGSSNSPCNGNAIGRLPWRTLGLPDLRDSSGERLWYAVSSNFKNNPRAGLLNSDTPGSITVRDSSGTIVLDASGATGAVAIIIAPGAPIHRQDGVQQNRSAANRNNPLHYLDNIPIEDNADFVDGGINGFFSGPVRGATGEIIANDQVLAITREELMAAVEKRVAMEVRNCVEAFATRHGNRYPWPAPLTNPASFNGIPNTYFGRIPSTTGDIDPEAKIYEILTQVSTAITALSVAATSEARTAAAQVLSAAEGALRLSLYQAELAADAVSTAAGKLQGSAKKADADKALNDAAALETKLLNTGLDVVVPQLHTLIGALQSKLDSFESNPTTSPSGTASALAKAAYVASDPASFYLFLDRLKTTNLTISVALANALAATSYAGTTAAGYAVLLAPTLDDFKIVVGAARNAITANRNLVATIQSQRASIQAYDLVSLAKRLNGSSAVPTGTAPYPDYGNWAAKLKSDSDAAATLIIGINSNSIAVTTARSNAQTAAVNASAAASNLMADPLNASLIGLAVSAGVTAYNTLYTLAYEVSDWASYLSSAQLSAYANSLSSFGASLISTTDAQALKERTDFVNNQISRLTTASSAIIAARDIAYTKLLTTSASAQAAVSNPSSANLDAAKNAANDAAAAITALFTAIANNGDNLSYTTLKYWKENSNWGYVYEHATVIFDLTQDIYTKAQGLDTMAATAISSAAAVASSPVDIAKLNLAVSAANTLVSGTTALLASLSSKTGEATSAGWSGSTGCVSNDVSGSFSWWDNGWQQHVFYQIGNPSSTAAGILTVNGNSSDKYRVIAIAHGQALAGQSRPSAQVSDYLEAGNADTSRNNGAPSPAPTFVQNAPGPTFNDRLGYQ